MFKFLKDYFQFSNNELRGAFMLLFLILIIFVAPRVYFKYKDPTYQDDKSFDAWIADVEYRDSIYVFNQNLIKDSIDAYYDNKKYSKNNKWKSRPQKDVDPIYFNFNPNKVGYSDLLKLGVSSKTANILIKFRDKGAIFYSKDDLLKVYGFDEELYLNLEDYILFPEKKKFDNKENVTEIVTIELNSSDTTDLKKLKGIGSVFAKRIVRYRDLLGGFYSKNQLLEVYDFTDELYEKINNNLTLDKSKTKKININTAEFKTLIRHPYISKEETNYILNYRNAILEYTDLNILVEKEIFNKGKFLKLEPYLTIK